MDKTAEKPAKKIKAPSTAFAHYAKAMRPKSHRKQADGMEEEPIDVHAKWNALSDDEKRPYVEAEQEERKAYAAANGPSKPDFAKK